MFNKFFNKFDKFVFFVSSKGGGGKISRTVGRGSDSRSVGGVNLLEGVQYPIVCHEINCTLLWGFFNHTVLQDIATNFSLTFK